MPDIVNKLVPRPTGFDSDVKAKAAQAERAWEAVTGSLTFLGAGGAAAVAGGLAIPPIAPFAAAVAAGSFYFKLRAKWAKEDPPRSDYEVVTDVRPPPIDLMVLMPPGPLPPGAAVVALLHAAAASIEATIVAVERALGAAEAVAGGADPDEVTASIASRHREAYEHARRSATLTAGLHSAAAAAGAHLQQQLRAVSPPGPAAHPVHVGDMLDDRALAHVLAAGIDERLLQIDVWWEGELMGRPLSDLLATAGDAAEQFGAALARWARDASFGGPGASSRS